MRSHPERIRGCYDPKIDLNLSDRARFCVVIRTAAEIGNVRYGNLVMEIYPDAKVADLLKRVGEITIQRGESTGTSRINYGDKYSAFSSEGKEVKYKTHGIDDGINCKIK